MPTPQTFSMASLPITTCRPGSSPLVMRSGSAPRSRPISARFEPVRPLRGFTTGFLRIPLPLAGRTRAIWQYWHVPALSGLLAT
jgi:hypothetical protein